jgi:sulfate/thiosulfate transport system substrate-binding protein
MQKWWNLGTVGAVIVGLSLIVLKNVPSNASARLINVSYDANRELYQALNPLFVASYEKETGRRLVIVQSHGGSSRQARVGRRGTSSAANSRWTWSRLACFQTPTRYEAGDDRTRLGRQVAKPFLAYTSTIVFVVRRNNPRGIKDWPDLLAARPPTEPCPAVTECGGRGRRSAHPTRSRSWPVPDAHHL